MMIRFGPERVSYMKPVGQTHVLVKGEDGVDLKVNRTVHLCPVSERELAHGSKTETMSTDL